jgi:hypothetical protein
MVYMSASFAHVAPLLAHLSGGTLRNLLARQDYFRRTGFWLIAGIPAPKSDYLT